MSVAFDVGIDFRQVNAIDAIQYLAINFRAADKENLRVVAASRDRRIDGGRRDRAIKTKLWIARDDDRLAARQ